MQNEGNALPLQQGLPPQEGCTNSTTQSVSRASLHDFQPQPMKFQPQFQIYPSSTQNYLPQPQNWGQGYVNPPQHSYTQHEYSTPQKFEGQQPFNEQNAFGPPPPYTPLAQNFQPQVICTLGNMCMCQCHKFPQCHMSHILCLSNDPNN